MFSFSHARAHTRTHSISSHQSITSSCHLLDEQKQMKDVDIYVRGLVKGFWSLENKKMSAVFQ